MTEKHYGWVKLEIPASCRERTTMDTKIQNMTKDFKSALGEFNIAIVSVQPTQVIEEEDCEPYFELTYEVESDRFNHTLISAMQNAMRIWGDYEPYERPVAILHSPDFWKTSLISERSKVSLGAIYFGNIQGGTFFNHWQISFWETNLAILRSEMRKDLLKQIFLDLEFDKNDMITVVFQCPEKDRKAKGNKMMRVSYQVGIRRTQIRRIVVDPLVRDDCGLDRIRVHFELDCPVLIRRGLFNEEHAKNAFAIPMYTRHRVFKCCTDDWYEEGYPENEAVVGSPFFTIEFLQNIGLDEIYLILSRIRDRTRVPIEFATIRSIDVPLGRRQPYNRWCINSKTKTIWPPTASQAPIFHDFLCALSKSSNGAAVTGDYYEERCFSYTYLIECLLSRGAVVKDQILLEEEHWHNFLSTIVAYYRVDDKLAEAALEELIHKIDSRKRIGFITKCYDKICQRRQRDKVVNGLTESELREGYTRVRKLVFTPTRTIYIPPETLMGNRVLRKFDKDGTRIIRITFRDDNNTKMRMTQAGDLLEYTTRDRLTDGVTVANREYGFLGSSNSQLRDHGAYFVLKYTQRQKEQHLHNCPTDDLKKYSKLPASIRRQLGKFGNMENVPKMLARLGQCFTQSRMTGIQLEWKEYTNIFDYEGGKNELGKCYTFSDGVGVMSVAFSERMAKMCKFGNSSPSCYQFRFRGCKGMISAEPYLDDMYKFAIAYGMDELEYGERNVFNLKCAFRPSQIKFEAKHSAGEEMEMVKFSSPVPVALNKPFINILDQVSEMQSLKCHKRVTGRIEELMDQQISMFARQMNDETYCRNRLKEFPRRIEVDFMRPMWGFTLSSEPFFRSLIKASIKFSITKQLKKEQIPIPKELGRSMLGVVDETGRLQYGQIFVQYSVSLSNKLPNKLAARNIHVGTVLLTKNPCIVSGDVRIFEAVDIPELHHMCDVVVFPQHGPRPHPDEMAGSDLDGDEYSVIWDPQLLLERNEEPFQFAAEKNPQPIDMEQEVKLMIDFMVDYFKLDAVGTIANSHLHMSDQYGLNANVCMDLAKKNCQAVDFTKSGVPPEPLSREWKFNEETNEWMPPELAERIPDYHRSNDRNTQYVSPRLCGKLYREFKAIDDVIQVSEENEEQVDIKIDETIRVNGYETRMESARKDLANYNGQLRTIMETYGIRTEAELFSGCIIDMRNKISDKDQDDMSFFSSNEMIEAKVSSLFKQYREEFFKEFGSFRAVLEQMPLAYDSTNVLHYQCVRKPSAEVMRKAVAWYRACYEEAKLSRETRKLSFAWLVYDVIAKIKEMNILETGILAMKSENPMIEMLQKHRQQLIEDNREQFDQFRNLDCFDQTESAKKAAHIVKMYMKKIPGLDSVMFVFLKWVKATRIMESSAMRIHHYALLFILFATKPVCAVSGEISCFFPKLTPREIESEDFEESEPISEQQKSILFSKFLEYLGSRPFRAQSSLSFMPIGLDSTFMRGEWRIVHQAALKTYYSVMFNLLFEDLPVSSDPEIKKRKLVREFESFVIEVPYNCNTDRIQEALKEFSGADEVQIRRMKRPNEKEGGRIDRVKDKPLSVRVIVSSRGSVESHQKLRKLSTVSIPIRGHSVGKEITVQMAELCQQKILDGLVD